MKITDIKQAIIDKLALVYPDTLYNYYDEEVEQGFDKPAFFIEVIPLSSKNSLYQKDKSLMVKINYFPESEINANAECYDMADNLSDLMSLKLNVNDDCLYINETIASIINTDNTDFLQFGFNIDYVDGNEVIEIINTEGKKVNMLPDEGLGYTQDTIQLMEELNLTEY